MDALLIINPNAGRVQKLGLERLTDLLAQGGINPRVVSSQDRETACASVREALRESPTRYRAIIAGGGDGTIHSVLPAFADYYKSHSSPAPIPLAVLPVGSVNVLARELELPLTLEAAIKVIAEGAAGHIDLGLFNDKPFVLMAGLGFDGGVVSTVNLSLKARIGSLAYILAGLRWLLSHPPYAVEITCGDERRKTTSWQLMVSNASRYTYRWTFAPQAKPDDGKLDLCYLPDLSKFARIRQTLAILTGKLHKADMQSLSGEKIILDLKESIPVQLDGDYEPAVTSATIEVLPKALPIIVAK